MCFCFVRGGGRRGFCLLMVKKDGGGGCKIGGGGCGRCNIVCVGISFWLCCVFVVEWMEWG